MSDGDTDNKHPIKWIAALAALTVFCCVLVLSIYSNEQRHERAYAAATYENNRRLDCIGLDSARTALCEAHIKKTPYKKSAEAYDLKAQQDMAKWALLMFVITASGVVFIALTLMETREILSEAKETTTAAKLTTKETKRIGEAQVRAYLTSKFGLFEVVDVGVYCELVLENVGQSPCRIIHYKAVLKFDDVESTSKTLLGRTMKQVSIEIESGPSIAVGGKGKISAFWGDIKIGADNMKTLSDGEPLHVEFTVQWLDVFGGRDNFLIFTASTSSYEIDLENRDSAERAGPLYTRDSASLAASDEDDQNQ